MNLGQIISEIQIVLDDPAIFRAKIVEEVNRKLVESMAIVKNPELITTDEVTVVENGLSVAMPDDYHHDLLEAYSTTQEKHLIIRTSSKALYADYDYPDDDDGDDIDECAVDGATLYVRPKSSQDDTIMVRYYGRPTALSDNEDIPSTVPDHLHKKLLVSGPLGELLPYCSMEPQAKATLTKLHVDLEIVGKVALKQFYPYSPVATPKARRKTRWF
jgi:hypothetical protein